MDESILIKPKEKVRVAFLAALPLFIAVNIGLAFFAPFYQRGIQSAVLNSDPNAKAHTKTWSWWLARKWLEQKRAPDVVLFGSSQMGSAICAADAQHLFQVVDSLTHRRVATLESALERQTGHPVSVFSLASPGAMCSDAYMASKALFTKELQPKVVIIGVAPRDFIDNTMPYPAATEPYKFYSRFVSPGKLLRWAYHDPMSWLQFGFEAMPCRKLGNYLADAATNSDNQALTADQKAGTQNGTALSAILGGGEAEPGKWLVPANIPPLWVDNTKEYKHRFQSSHPPVYSAEKQFFTAFLNNMQSRGITVVVVGMPSLPMNRALLSDKFWTAFRSTLNTQCALHNAQFLDLTDSPVFNKEDYLDTVHLNAKGGMKLFSVLAQYASSDPLVAARLNEGVQPITGKVETASQSDLK